MLFLCLMPGGMLMTFGKRMKIALIGAVIASLAGSLFVLLLSESARMLTIISLIVAVAVLGLVLVAQFILEGKPAKVRVPVFILIIVLSVCTVLSVALYNIGKKITFPGTSDEEAYEELCDMEGVVVQIDEGNLSGWRIPATAVAEGEPRPVILYFGGNGENSSNRVENMLSNEKSSYLYENYDFFFMDYPSYGNNDTELTEDSLYQFTLDAYNYVSSLDTTSGITLLSYSIGNGPAMYLASQDDVNIDSMIMLAPYNSGYDLYNANLNIFYGPLRLLVAFKLPSYKYAGDVECPVTMIASTDDEIIPYESSRNLFSSLSGGAANFVTVEGVLHNDFFSSPDVINAVRNCLEAA